jgi:hypothetical protein
MTKRKTVDDGPASESRVKRKKTQSADEEGPNRGVLDMPGADVQYFPEVNKSIRASY